MLRLKKLPFRSLLAAMLSVATMSSAVAAPKGKKGDPLERPSRDTKNVYLDPDSADDDFRFVGEYTGFEWVTSTSRSSRKVSLQVNAVGGGKFVATKMFGGTPDSIETSATPIALEGDRFRERVELQGPRFRYVIDGQFAYAVDSTNTVVGKLERSQRISPTLGRVAPAGAVVLFDGTGTDRFKNGKMTEDGLLQAGTETLEPWNDFQLHLEFKLPYKPEAFGQHRGNSGVYIQSRYELQVLDSFGWVPAFNDCSSLYRTKRPDRNATLPPLTWQTYDIDFVAPKFAADGTRTQNARVTVWLNGIKTHDNVAVPNKTGAGKPEGPFPLPTKIQAHKNPVVYRNVWLLPDRARSKQFAVPGTPVPIDPTPVTLSPSAVSLVHPLGGLPQ